jgi:putative heme degradation protein
MQAVFKTLNHVLATLPDLLAAVGPMLCLYRHADVSPLQGWASSVKVTSCVGVDIGGLREALHFYNRENQLCWQLFLLPDSDFYNWSQLQERLPTELKTAIHTKTYQSQPLISACASRAIKPLWLACPLRIHALPEIRRRLTSTLTPDIAISNVSLSEIGQHVAHDIAHTECRPLTVSNQ